MIKICPECININVDKEICQTCGFPLSKKIIGRIDDYFFYDSLELINMGQVEGARKKILEKKGSSPDQKLDLLLDKISVIEQMTGKAEDHCKRAMSFFQSSQYDNALAEIKSAKEIYSNPRFNDIETQIQAAANKEKSLAMAKEKYDEGMLLLKSGDTSKAIGLLRSAQELDPSNPVYKNTYRSESESYIQSSVNNINGLLSSGNFKEAELHLHSLMAVAGSDSRVGILQNQILGGLAKKKKQKNTGVLFAVILGLLLLVSFGWWYMQNKKEDDKWFSARDQNNIPALEQYLSQNPASKYYVEATQKLNQLLSGDSVEWMKVTEKPGRKTAENYIAAMTSIGGKHLPEAQNILDSLDWNLISQSEDQADFQNYINTHSDSKFSDLAREKLSQQVSEDERLSLLQFITGYFIAYQSKDLETVMTYYDPITPVFGPKKDITKADLRLLFENDIKTVSNSSSKIDPVSFKVKKDQNGNYFLSFYSDSYTTRIKNEPSEDPEFSATSQVNYYTNMEWSLTLTPDKKIKVYKYKIISEQIINQ